jgi:co-chaperonin GroES (HSP10)
MPNVAMLHEIDPKVDILSKLGEILEGYEILNNDVLIATYRRPEKTAGGIVIPDNVLKEDIYQGKAGLVVKIGPSCDFPTVPIALHDWVVIRPSDGIAMELLVDERKNTKVHCRLVMDKFIKVKISHPSLVW